MLEPLDIPVQDLYDGLEEGFYTRTFAAPVDGIAFTVDDLGPFAELQGRIGDAAFERVIADARIKRRGDAYQGAHDLSLEFLIRDGHLLVLAIGERNAGRFVVTLQGAWRLAE